MIPCPSLLTRLSSGIALAATVPFLVLDDLLTAYADAAHARALRGELAAARTELAEALNAAHDAAATAVVGLTISEGCRDDVTAKLADMEKARDVWRNKATDSAEQVATLYAEANIARTRIHELETLLDAKADVVAKVEPVAAVEVTCAWCLGDSGGECVVHAGNGAERTPLCAACWCLDAVNVNTIIARVATRAASCESRRTSADPLNVQCPHCFAAIGEACPASLAGRVTADTIVIGR